VQAGVGATFAAGAYSGPTSGGMPGGGGTLASSLAVTVDSGYVSALGDTNGDGYLSPAEIAAGEP
jgi:hypothetical protein